MAEPLKAAAIEPAAVAEEPLPRGDETILVVEDDARVRRVTVARLRVAGYQVIEAGNGPEALTKLDQNKVDVLFTDVVMPGGMTGDQLAQHARSVDPAIKVLLTSGYAEPMIAGREQAQSGTWLKKPYTAMDLTSVVRRVLDQC